MKLLPEQEAQSPWQERQEPEEEKVPEGQEATQRPSEASWLFDVSELVEPANDDPIRKLFEQRGHLRGRDLERFGVKRAEG